MKKNYLLNQFTILQLLFFSIGAINAQCPNIVWEDNFSGTSLDETKWNYQIGDGCAEGICGWGNNELQSYQQDNISVSDGTLKITARKERIKGSQYTSGRINSKNKGDFTYGRFEASIKLPAGDGLWPAFWMLSTNEPYGGWPQSGEIDIMEFVASKQDEVLGYIHYGDPYPNNQSQGNTYQLDNAVFPSDFHEFAVEWEPGEIRWYVDGILFSKKTSADVAPANWPFDNDFHFLLNVAVGGNLGGEVNNNMLPATMEVDYVRVYDGFKPSLEGDKVVSNQETGVSYSISNLSGNTNVNWTVPAGATVTSGQGTSSIVVDFGTESGDVTASFNDGCTAQVLKTSVTVEPPYHKVASFENFDEEASIVFNSATGSLNEVSNPAPSALNPSGISGEYIRNNQEQYDVLVYDVTSITDASLYVDKTKKFFMDVYTAAPLGTEIIIQLETPTATATNYPSGRHSRYVATVENNDNWQRLEFELLDRPDAGAPDSDVSQMILLFNSNTYTSDTYYFDNLDSYEADLGSASNQAPTVSITSPSNNSSFPAGSNVNITADANDADGTITQVEFFANSSSLGIDTTAPYEMDWQVTEGTSQITANATDNAGAVTTSSVINITGESGGSASSVYVSSITTGTADAGKGKKYGVADVTILNDLGQPVANASVSGTFSGTFTETASGLTDANGIATISTQGSAKGALNINFCVDDVTATGLVYDSASNSMTCNGTAQSSTKTKTGTAAEDEFAVLPNPASEIVRLVRNSEEIYEYLLYDMNGRIVLKNTLGANDEKINISGLRSGWYILRLWDSAGKQKTLKIYKK